MKIKLRQIKTKISLSEMIEGALFLFVVLMTFKMTEYGYNLNEAQPYIFQYLRFACYALCLIKILLKGNYTKNSLFFAALALGLCILCALTNGENLIFFYMLFLVAANGCNSERLIRACLYAQEIVVFLTTFLAFSGILDNSSVFSGGRLRHFLGFMWVTYAPGLFFFICIEILYLKKGILGTREYILLMAYAVWLYVETKTRMVFFMTVIVLTFFFAFGKKLVDVKKTKLFKWMIGVPWICALISYSMVLLYGYNNQTMLFFDVVINRLGLAYSAVQKYGIHLFGQPISWIGNSVNNMNDWRYNYVDCAYVQTVLDYGVFFLALILIVYSVILYNAYRCKQFYLSYIMAFVLILCITEPRLFDLSFNPFILLCTTKNFWYKKD